MQANWKLCAGSPWSALCALLVFSMLNSGPAWAQDTPEGEDLTLAGQHAKDKLEMQKIDTQLKDMNAAMTKARGMMGQVESQLSKVEIKDFVLTASFGQTELFPGTLVTSLMYNNQSPGPEIRVEEGDPVRIAFHNQLKVPTSLYFEGMILPASVDGLPRQNAGLIAPNATYTYQFFATQPGTYWYHPQIIHADQLARGMCGALIVEPRRAKTYDHDQVLILQQWAARADLSLKGAVRGDKAQSTSVSASAPNVVTYFTVNGKSAPAIPALAVHQGERWRLRVINAARVQVPFTLTGHRFEIMGVNGSAASEPRLIRDTVCLMPGDRYDLEFVADNPGVWSLSSQLADQTTNSGQFPGGMAMVVRYLGKK